MLTDENTTDFKCSKCLILENSPDVADKMGQMLSIYLPEGSVIVDRTDVNLSMAPQAIVEQIAPKTEKIEPVSNETPVVHLQTTLQEVVQLAAAEVLRITGATLNQTQNGDSSDIKTREESLGGSAAPSVAKNVHMRSWRKIHWVQDINIIFVAFLIIVAIAPSALSSGFGLAIYASKTSHPLVLISSGDLLVSQVTRASQLKVNDLLLVRDGNSWRLATRVVTAKTTNGGFSTITTASTRGGIGDETNRLANNSRSYKVLHVTPKLGYVPIILASPIAKIGGGIFMLILNLAVYGKRFRRPRLEMAIR